MNKTLRRVKSVILVALTVCLVMTSVVPVQAASSKYKKYKGTWVEEGDPSRYLKIKSCSSKKMKVKLEVNGGLFDQNGYCYGDFHDSTKYKTVKIKKNKAVFTIKTKKGYKLKVYIKLQKYKPNRGYSFATGIKYKIKSSNKMWSTGYTGIWKYI